MFHVCRGSGVFPNDTRGQAGMAVLNVVVGAAIREDSRRG